MSRTEALNRALTNLQSSSPDIEASAVVSVDGLIIASHLPQGLEEAQIAAMSAAILSIATRTAIELRRGAVEQLFVRGAQGYVLIMQAGPHAVLSVSLMSATDTPSVQYITRLAPYLSDRWPP